MNKKRMITIIVTVISVLTLSAIAWAATNSSGVPTAVAAGYNGSGATAKGVVVVSGLSNSAGCADSRVWFHPNFSDTDKILSLATAAQLSGKKLSCFVSGCNYNMQQGTDCALSN